MNTSSTITFRTDKVIKDQAQQVLGDLGVDMSTAMNVCLRQIIRYNGFPFKVVNENPNSETLASFAEGEKLMNNPKSKRYSSVDELFNDVGIK